MSVSADTGCNWAFAGGPLAGERMIDLVVRPDNSDAVLGLTGTWISDAGLVDGSLVYESRVFASSDDGAHFAALPGSRSTRASW